MSEGNNKLTLGRFIYKLTSSKVSSDEGYGASREDLLSAVKSPVTKLVLTDEAYKALEEISKEDVFVSVSDFDGELTPFQHGNLITEINLKLPKMKLDF